MGESLRSRLESQLKDAMRARDTERRDAIRYLLAGVKNAEIDQKGPLSAEGEIALLRQQAKQRQEAIDQFRAGGRTELAEREASQLRVIEGLLPQQMSDDELDAFVTAGIDETGAQGPKEMGKAMGVLSRRAEGRVDGRRLSAAVRRALDGPPQS
jgi:uncharacterized protein YqeY